MAENPNNNFQPSSGTITEFFHYSTLRDVFKTYLYTGSKVPSIYDPYIGKILTFTQKRETAISNMRHFLDNIIIRGIRTNINFLKNLLDNESLKQGKTIVDFINLKHEILEKPKTEKEVLIAGALLSADFHIQNRKKNYKAKLEKMKQPGFFKKIIKEILR
jgi:acetyl-CoA carboxylase biotin carboxylase subunit